MSSGVQSLRDLLIRNLEMFVVLEGSGTLRVAGELLPLKKGDVVFIPSKSFTAQAKVSTTRMVKPEWSEAQ
jgi:mannose-6-phosphate isomerase class I